MGAPKARGQGAGCKAAAVFALHKRRKFRFLFRMKASHFLVRQESGKEAPGPSVPLKNTNSNANNWRICVFLTRHSDGPGTQPAAQEPGLRPVGLGTRLRAQNGPGTPTANEVAFSVARETARMTFARSHAARVPENGIWNRAANLAPAVAGEIISAQRPFRTHAVRNAGLCAGLKPHRARRDSQYHFSTHP